MQLHSDPEKQQTLALAAADSSVEQQQHVFECKHVYACYALRLLLPVLHTTSNIRAKIRCNPLARLHP